MIWLPINTAPMNERVILTDGEKAWIGYAVFNTPTHWLPIPELPKTDKK